MILFSPLYFFIIIKKTKKDRKPAEPEKKLKPAQAPAFFEKVAALLRDAAIKDLALYIRR